MRTKEHRATRVTVAVLVSVALVLTACQATPAPTPTSPPPISAKSPVATPAAKGPAPTGQIVVAMAYEVTKTIAPEDALDQAMVMTVFNVVDRLVQRDVKSYQPKPMLAEKWEQVKSDTWRFYLRKGVKFQDGSPLNAEVVAFNVNRLLDPTMLINSNFPNLKEAVVVDDYTVDLVTNGPDAILPLRIMKLMIESKKFIEENPELVPIKSVGTGPYKFVEWVKGQYLKLTADPDYQGPPAAVKDVTYVWRGESSVRAAMLKVGEADIAWQISPEDAQLIKPPLKVKTAATNETYLFTIDMAPGLKSKASLRDKRIRQAIALAIDKNAIVDNIMAGNATVAAQPWPTVALGYNPDRKPYPYDPEQAKKLVAEAKAAGVPVEEEQLTFYSTSGKSPRDTEISEALLTMWRDVGLNVKLQFLEPGKHTEMRRAVKPDQEHPDMINLLTGNELFDASHAAKRFQSWQKGGAFSMYSNPEVDALLDKADTEPVGSDERPKTFQKIWDILYDDYYVVPIFYQNQIHGVSDKIEWAPRVDLVLNLTEITWAK